MIFLNILRIGNHNRLSAIKRLHPVGHELGNLKFAKEVHRPVSFTHAEPPKRIPYVHIQIHFKNARPITAVKGTSDF